eukprot:scaffold42125_cov33-Phaeocystis_antarctica.AAC.2
MLSAAVSFSAASASFNGAMPSRMSQSKVARSGAVEMAKKSVGDMKEADLKGKRVRARHTPATRHRTRPHVSNLPPNARAGAGALRPERAARWQDHHG